MNKPIVENESINSTLSEGTIKTSKKANIPRDIRIFNSCPEGNSKLGKKLDVEASYLGRFKFFNLVRANQVLYHQLSWLHFLSLMHLLPRYLHYQVVLT